MKCVGLYLVRNEVDIVEISLRHHLATAIDEAIVVDNGSTDGTLELLCSLAKDLPVLVASEPGEYAQAAIVTRMAQQAARHGADWVLPIDADEFWIVRNGTSLREWLSSCDPAIGVINCDVVNFVQSRDEAFCTPTSLLRATKRVNPGGPAERAEELVENGDIAFVEIEYPRKCIARADAGMEVSRGNHAVKGVSGSMNVVDDIACLHIPMRARSIFTTKIDQGRRVEEAGADPGECWHVRRWWRMARDGILEDEWAANSYKDGGLLVQGKHHPVVHDETLKSVVEPWIEQASDVGLPPPSGLPPLIGAYRAALPTVPGWLSDADFRIFVEVDQIQRDAGVKGDLFEIGTYCGKTAILLKYLTGDGEKLTVCDLFNDNDRASTANREENARWYQGFARGDFEHHLLRFHRDLPEIMVGPSTEIDGEARARTCRLVHIDGSHVHAIVREDIATAKQLLAEGGLVAMDDISTAHNPGSALAAWEAVCSGTLEPVCLTDAKLYATFGPSKIRWADSLREWAATQPDLAVELHELGGWTVPRIIPTSVPPDPGLNRIGVLEPSTSPIKDVGHGHRDSSEGEAGSGGYDGYFYDLVSDSARSSAQEIVPLVLDLTSAKSVVDVGCGTGTWLSIFRENGVDDVLGLDGSHVDLARLEIPGPSFQARDLEEPLCVARSFDLAVCLEVAEHLSAGRAATLIDDLIGLAPIVLFSAALPLQGGVGHVNEQWANYWITKFAERGMSVIDAIRPVVWENEKVAMWYAQNCLLFATPGALEAHPALGQAKMSTDTRRLDLVHPSLYLYYRLGISEPAARVPLNAADMIANVEPVNSAISEESMAASSLPMPMGLRMILHQLPIAARRSISARLGRLRHR